MAKELLTKNDEIVVVNAEKAVVSGRRRYTIERYKMERDVGSVRKGPRFPKEADRIFRRTVRGMLPMKNSRGIEALKRLRVYIGVPMEFKGKEFEKLEEYQNKHVANVTTLYDISKELGSKVIVDGN
ncbi:MAG: 50S ribosomal protein L13 [Candidatus Thermoplasmatota archaeon]|nr:50S ribosomal protein L13 [Candidatus Thermoplasmatota archaeon]MCL5788888.1 50S ribosomal protein L13 [Candidatus Thermoplasmatota archaeon]